MKYLVFRRENNKFDDILKDNNIKKLYKTKILYTGHLILGLDEELADTEKSISYIMLKYGDDMINLSSIIPDRSPIPYKDYTPAKK